LTLASSIGQTVNRATGVSFNAYQFGMAGFEPAVIGKTMNAKLNQVSAPVKGNAGVYVIAPVSITKNTNPFNVKSEKAAITSRVSYSLPNAVVMDMRNNADIEDNRLNFY
jgi:peptidyl-prolyl cis-trans isomerase D